MTGKKREVSVASLANLRPPWKKGCKSPNPTGIAPKSILYQRVLMAVLADFEKHGAEAIQKLRETNPLKYLEFIVSLLPKEMEIDHFSGSTHRSATVSELAKFIKEATRRSEGDVIECVSAKPIKKDMT